ncbi:MAG: hypothetical protein WC958_01350 [Dehalococcoidales bacterium]
MANKYHSDTHQRAEKITYASPLSDSGNLLSETLTIENTSKADNPDLIATLITPAPISPVLKVCLLCQRLNISIVSLGGEEPATKLFYCVEVNGAQAVSGQFEISGADNYVSWDLTKENFNLGIGNVIDIFLWVDSGFAEINIIRLLQGVGTSSLGWSSFPIEGHHNGLVQVSVNFACIGTGTAECHLLPLGAHSAMSEALQSDIASKLCIVCDDFAVRLKGSAPNDLNLISSFNVALISGA